MKKIYKLTLIGALLSASSLFSYDADNGKKLYLEAKCQKCHTSEHFTSKKRKVNDFEKLQSRVKKCALGMGAGWFEEDMVDVTNYLNDDFYKFDKFEVSKNK